MNSKKKKYIVAEIIVVWAEQEISKNLICFNGNTQRHTTVLQCAFDALVLTRKYVEVCLTYSNIHTVHKHTHARMSENGKRRRIQQYRVQLYIASSAECSQRHKTELVGKMSKSIIYYFSHPLGALEYSRCWTQRGNNMCVAFGTNGFPYI